LEASTNLRHAKGSLKKMINQPITKLKGLEPDLVSRLTISDSQTVFATAQLKNIDYLKKQQALKKAHVELNKAQGKFYPTVSLSITAKQDLNADIFDMDNKTSGGSLSTSINIYNGGKDVLDTEQKTLKSFAAEDDLSNLLYDLGVNSSKVVADFENAQARRLASKAAEDSSLKKLNAMHEKHLMGQASELELYSAITQASKAQKDHINASHQVILKYIDVAILMGELDDSHILQINQLLGADIEFESIADLSSASDLATMILSPKNPG
jgi:outer membrane protein TolC